MCEFGYYNTETWEFIPVDKMEPGEHYWLNIPEHLELAKLWYELNNKIITRFLWGRN